MPEIKERPILFSAPMVRAILEGRKKVTRRALNERALKNINIGAQIGECHELPTEGPLHPNSVGYYNDFCPFGQPGDRLWVRETFALLGNEDGVCVDWSDQMVKGDERAAARIFRASCTIGDYSLWQVPDKAEWKPDTESLQYEGSWRPSIHMPRWASRILLEITEVRVERLQGITYEDAVAEGVYRDNSRVWTATDEGGQCHKYPEPAFRDLWKTTGGDWDANPWVWVVEFKRVTP
jgi:hypothetical protein